MSSYTFKAKLWVWPGESAQWRFINVPKAMSEKIKKTVKTKRGFGSIRVRVKAGKTVWDTSIFPDSKSGTYLLPVKASVRRAEGIEDGDTVLVTVRTQ